MLLLLVVNVYLPTYAWICMRTLYFMANCKHYLLIIIELIAYKVMDLLSIFIFYRFSWLLAAWGLICYQLNCVF